MSLSISSQTCDRNEFISQTLPTWLNYPCDEIVIFDQPGKERAYDVVSQYLSNPKVKLIQSVEGWGYNNSKGRNASVRSTKSSHVLQLDIDVKIDPLMPPDLTPPPGIFVHYIMNKIDTCNLMGSVLFKRSDFDKINGYNERCIGWGAEDDDFYNRLEGVGVRRWHFPPYLHHIEHGDDKRIQSYGYKSKQDSWQKNAVSCHENPWTPNDVQTKFNAIIYQGTTEERVIV